MLAYGYLIQFSLAQVKKFKRTNEKWIIHHEETCQLNFPSHRAWNIRYPVRSELASYVLVDSSHNIKALSSSQLLLHSRNTYTTIHIYMRKQNQQKWRTNTLLEKNIPLTLYLKGLQKGYERVMCERWVGDWTDCNILTPISSVFSSPFFSFSWAAQPGVLRAQPSMGAGSHYNILSPTCSNCLWHRVI